MGRKQPARPVQPAVGNAPSGDGNEATWGTAARDEPRWPAAIAIVMAIVLYATLPDKLTYGPRWLFPILEGILLVPLLAVSPRRSRSEAHRARVISIALIAIINLANVGSLVLLAHNILVGHKHSGTELIFNAMEIWLTNVLVFGLWYWELDRGGPTERCQSRHREPDFLFPQMANPTVTRRAWTPTFLDYLYVSFTNATAFSPTDTMPLTEWAKTLMSIQSLASLLTVGLVAARAVNILH